MICQHCKKEHEEGTRYCPFTGKEIQVQLQSCPNPDCANHGRNVLPTNHLFCPLCGTKLNSEEPPELNIKEKNDKRGDYDINILSFGPAKHKVANAIMNVVRPASGTVTLEEAYRTSGFEGIEEERAQVIKDELSAAGATIEMKHFHYYVCDQCGATYRKETMPKKCVKCRSRNSTFICVNEADVIRCPHCHSFKMNYEDGMYRCADDFCGLYSTVEEVHEYNDRLKKIRL